MQHLKPVPHDKNLLRYRDLPTGNVVDVEVAYLKGSSRHSRGLYLYLRPVTVDDMSESFDVLSGLRARICRLDRSSPALLRRVAEAADDYVVAMAALYRSDQESATTRFNELAARLAGVAAA